MKRERNNVCVRLFFALSGDSANISICEVSFICAESLFAYAADDEIGG